jgi:hypothetical protein
VGSQLLRELSFIPWVHQDFYKNLLPKII